MKIIKYFLQFVLIIILFFIFKLIGYKNSSNLGSQIGKIFGKFIRSDRIIKNNLSIIENNSDFKIDNKDKIVKKVFSNYGRILAEYVHLSKFKGPLKKYVTLNGENFLREIKQNKKNVVFISGHFNNFELMAMFIDAYGINVSAIYRPLNNIFLNKIMEKIRTDHICKNQIKKGISGTRELITFLKKNFSVALMIDQRVSEGIRSDFFGTPAFTTTIPAQIIKKFNCEIVPVHIERYDDIKFNLTFDKPIKFDENTSTEEITLKLNKILEIMVLKDPSQWILTHNRWK
ncbi:lipid A biosynthesis acyltransferase [Candidatus Pelagibacter sp.]|nr:lipid A biosynthesis acyltransferase [Candidatus Pelagibacter sp.]